MKGKRRDGVKRVIKLGKGKKAQDVNAIIAKLETMYNDVIQASDLLEKKFPGLDMEFGTVIGGLETLIYSLERALKE